VSLYSPSSDQRCSPRRPDRYNEDEELFCRTLHGVMSKLFHLSFPPQSRNRFQKGELTSTPSISPLLSSHSLSQRTSQVSVSGRSRRLGVKMGGRVRRAILLSLVILLLQCCLSLSPFPVLTQLSLIPPAEVVVCIVADGRKQCHPRVLDWFVLSSKSHPLNPVLSISIPSSLPYCRAFFVFLLLTHSLTCSLAALGVYQPSIATNRIDDKPVQSHVFEFTSQMSIAPDLTFKGLEKGIVPTQIMFCLKENKSVSSSSLFPCFSPADFCWLHATSAKKINSHRWALQAFAPILDPNVVMLLDVGTKPAANSLCALLSSASLVSRRILIDGCGQASTSASKSKLTFLPRSQTVRHFPSASALLSSC
jgi:hypothetical protein